MIAVLNIAIWVILVAGFWFAVKRKSWKIAAVTVGVVLLMNAFQPSYFPKGTIERTKVPEFSESDAKIEDRNSKPVDGAVRDQKMENEVKSGLPFKTP